MAIFLFSAGHVFADGKMFAEHVNTSIPYQRALILFDEGRQIMVLQSQYEIPNDPGNHKLGWVVPVPAVPDLYSMESYEADWMFNILSSYTRPKPITSSGFSEWVILVGMALGFGCFIVSLLLLVLTRKRRMRRVAVTFMLISVVSFPFTLLSTRAWKGARGVEVISTGQVGIYDTKVVRAESAQDLITWLNEHSFRFDETDVETFQSYIDRGWCFTTATVDASVAAGDPGAVSGNLLAPLILDFPIDTPVYPTALTATGGHDTEILIYMATRIPRKTTSDLELRFLGHMEGMMYFLLPLKLTYMDAEVDLMPTLESEIFHLHKFKSTLTPAQMAEDIEFLPDPDAQPYRETQTQF